MKKAGVVSKPRKTHRFARRKYHERLERAIFDVDIRLDRLARLGRSGQWILHGHDLYEPYIDTRPTSRNAADEHPIRGLVSGGYPIDDRGIIWSGTGPAPDFQDATYWEKTRQELDEQIQRVQDGRVVPQFTVREVRVLEALEQQHEHVYHSIAEQNRKRMEHNKCKIFETLFSLAALGRPGQWILHHEELHHPAIDTRPQTRAAEPPPVLIRDATYTGSIAAIGSGVSVAFELLWSGEARPPNFADLNYWEKTSSHLIDSLIRVRQGCVQPQFTAEERRTLESLEATADHAFAIYAREGDEQRLDAAGGAHDATAERDLFLAKMRVAKEMEDLWDTGYAGKWVLHHERLYIPQLDSRRQDRQLDDSGSVTDVLVEEVSNLRYCGYRHYLPDLNDVAFWEDKWADLRKKRNDVQAGKIRHHFTAGDLLRIELLERDDRESVEDGDVQRRRQTEIEAWLDRSWSLPALHSRPSMASILELLKWRKPSPPDAERAGQRTDSTDFEAEDAPASSASGEDWDSPPRQATTHRRKRPKSSPEWEDLRGCGQVTGEAGEAGTTTHAKARETLQKDRSSKKVHFNDGRRPSRRSMRIAAQQKGKGTLSGRTGLS